MYETHKIFEESIPCDGCEHFIECKEAELACRAFAAYVFRGTQPQSYTARIPTHYIFNKVFKDEDERALKSYLKSKIQGELL